MYFFLFCECVKIKHNYTFSLHILLLFSIDFYCTYKIANYCMNIGNLHFYIKTRFIFHKITNCYNRNCYRRKHKKTRCITGCTYRVTVSQFIQWHTLELPYIFHCFLITTLIVFVTTTCVSSLRFATNSAFVNSPLPSASFSPCWLVSFISFEQSL